MVLLLIVLCRWCPSSSSWRCAPPPPPLQVPFKYVDDLASVWCEWAEMELRHQNFKRAIDVLKRWAAAGMIRAAACVDVVMMCR